MNDFRTCTADNQEEFDSWLLPIEKVAKLIDSDPNEICFAKAKGNLVKFFYSVNFKGCSWVHLKEKMQAEFSKVATASHTSLMLMHCKQKCEESLNAFIYRGSKLLQCCGISPEYCRNKFKTDLFFYQLSSEEIARRVIRKHPNSETHAFGSAKEEEKELRILHGLSKDNVYPVAFPNGAHITIQNHTIQ